MVKKIEEDGAPVVIQATASAVHADPMHMTSSLNLIDIPVGFNFDFADDEDVQAELEQITVVREKWITPNYDKMTLSEFVALLEAETFTSAMARKRLHDSDNKQEGGVLGEPYLDGDGNGLTFSEMCNRVAARLLDGAIAGPKVELPSPEIDSSGSKYRIVKNFGAICTAIGRTKEDVMEYLRVELQPDKASVNEQEQLSLKISKLTVDRFIRVLLRFVELYVECKACKSILTYSSKENSRIQIKCTKCSAVRFEEVVKEANFVAINKRKKN